MFFVVDKFRLHRIIAITRDDRRLAQQGKGGPFFRIEARNGRLKLTGQQVEAEFPATVYEEGVLFLRITLFRRAIQHLPESGPIAIQVHRDGLQVGDVMLPLESNEMLLYADSARAPFMHPDEQAAAARPDSQGRLFPAE